MEMDYNQARLAVNDFDFAVTELDRQWHNSPVFSVTQPVHQAYGAYQYAQPADPWLVNGYRPNYPNYRSHSLERLNQPFYVARSPVPSPVHTPNGSPVIGRRSSPALNQPARPRRPVPPLPPLPPLPPSSKAPSGKPPLPNRQRPVLMKSKTVDCADDVLLSGHQARPLDVNNKIPSLDSLYEQLKALSGSSTPPVLPGPQPIIDNQLAADLTAVALEIVANSPLARRRSSTFSGSSTPYAQYSRPKPEVDERLQRLEGDKDSLQMQVSILMDQIEAQTDKIADLERTLSERAFQLQRSEETLQKELLSRSAAETRQLELLSDISSLKLRYAALEKDNMELRGQLKRSEQDMITLVSQCYSLCGATLGPGFNKKEILENLQSLNLRNSSASPSSMVSGTPPRHPGTGATELPRRNLQSANSSISLQSGPTSLESPRSPFVQSPKTPPANVFRKVDPEAYNSLPRQTSGGNGSSAFHNNNNNSPSSSSGGGGGSGGGGQSSSSYANKRAVVFGKHFQLPSLRASSKRSSSAPNLAETEQKGIQEQCESLAPDHVENETITSPHSPSLSNVSKHSKSGLKKIFEKLKRTNSGALEGDPCSPPQDDFRRGAMRATAGPRLGYGWKNASPAPAEKTIQEPDVPFAQWSADDIASWLHDMGLHLYVSEAQRWNCRGKLLLEAPFSEIEKELGVKHPLHRKKLVLALEARGRAQDPMSPMPIMPELLKSAGRLDHQWVVRWLDDIGLPQYKDSFLEARLDGRMLHLLTVDDLCTHLKVTNLLHLICIRRGVQVLRLNQYNPSCLQRRSVPEDPAYPTSSQVALWTNHRVMEWLRAVDLSEYAPNMRGSGVHGGLLVYEPRFTAELLATLLSIPAGKTLLRRHLATHFNQLVGREVVQAKREMETSSPYPALTPVAKVKIIKKSQFTLKRKKGRPDEFDPEEWVCPSLDSIDFEGERAKVSPVKSTDL